MIEKYGISLEEIPPTDDQLRVLKKIMVSKNEEFYIPKTAAEAEELINKDGE